MQKLWSDLAWAQFQEWTSRDRKTLRRIYQLIQSIDRNGYNCIGKPEPLKGEVLRRASSQTLYDSIIAVKTGQLVSIPYMILFALAVHGLFEGTALGVMNKLKPTIFLFLATYWLRTRF